jgi:uncharacterized protein (TIGR03382 family)
LRVRVEGPRWGRGAKIDDVTIAISWGMYLMLLAVLVGFLLRRRP